MKSIREQTGCRIAVPGPNDEKKDVITVMGTKEGVEKAKKILEASVAQLKDLKEEEVTVPQKYHKNFTQRRAEPINRISDECGGVQDRVYSCSISWLVHLYGEHLRFLVKTFNQTSS